LTKSRHRQNLGVNKSQLGQNLGVKKILASTKSWHQQNLRADKILASTKDQHHQSLLLFWLGKVRSGWLFPDLSWYSPLEDVVSSL
jgi:hypothetical protein